MHLSHKDKHAVDTNIDSFPTSQNKMPYLQSCFSQLLLIHQFLQSSAEAQHSGPQTIVTLDAPTSPRIRTPPKLAQCQKIAMQLLAAEYH